jgi:hypothetical protein
MQTVESAQRRSRPTSVVLLLSVALGMGSVPVFEVRPGGAFASPRPAAFRDTLRCGMPTYATFLPSVPHTLSRAPCIGAVAAWMDWQQYPEHQHRRMWIW